MRRTRALCCLAGASSMLLAGVAVTGCTAAPGGPALWGSEGRDADTLCSSVALGDRMLVADVLEAPDDTVVEVLAVEPVNPRNLRIAEIAIAPLEDGSGSIGNSSLPPTDALTETIWNARVPVSGYQLAAGDRADVLVVAERTTGDEGSIETIRIRYRAGGITWEKSASTFYQFRETCLG